MSCQSWRGANRLVKTLSIILILSSCSHITYTPAESAERIQLLESQKSKLIQLLSEAEEDLNRCVDLLKRCQPEIGNSPQ